MIFSLLTLPLDGFKFVMNTLIKVAEEQWTDDAPLKQQLLELQVALDNGDISEDEYVEHERVILQGLRDIQNRKREMAGLEPEDENTQPFSGNVKEGSGVELTWTPQPENEDDNHR
jgi:hypothetical protein